MQDPENSQPNQYRNCPDLEVDTILSTANRSQPFVAGGLELMRPRWRLIRLHFARHLFEPY